MKKKFVNALSYSFKFVYSSSKIPTILYILCMLITTAFPLLTAWILKLLLDILLAEEPNISSAIYCIVLYVICLLSNSIVNRLMSLFRNLVFQKAEHQYERIILEKTIKLPLGILDTNEGRNMIDEVQYAKITVVYLTEKVISVISLLYTIIVAFSALLTFNVLFSLLLIVLSVPGIVLSEYFDHKADIVRKKTAPDSRKSSYYRWMLTDGWPAKDIRMYDLTDDIKIRYNEEKRRYIRLNRQLDIKRMCSQIIAEIILRSGEILFTFFAVYKCIQGELSIGDTALYISFAVTCINCFQGTTWLFQHIFMRGMERFDVFWTFINIPELNKTKNGRKLDKFQSLQFEDVYFKYPTEDDYILKGVSFTLNRGDRLSIVGMNGTGKSTLVKLMLGLYEIQSGRILVNGYTLSDYNIEDVREIFSVLFQDFVRYPLTLRENVAFSDISHMGEDERIEDALKESDVYSNILPKLENGINSMMSREFDDSGTELSKGQWQKVALARTYFKNAEIIVFDEPSAALDAEAEEHIFSNFEKMSKDKTGIMISHRISSARMATKIIVLDGGKIIEEGTHNRLVNLSGKYAELYELQRKKYTVEEST